MSVELIIEIVCVEETTGKRKKKANVYISLFKNMFLFH